MALDLMVNGVPVTHYPYGLHPVLVPVQDGPPNTFTYSVGDPFEVVKEDQVTPMTPRSVGTGDPVPLFTVAPGALPTMLLPELEGWARVNGGEWFPIASEDVPDLVAGLAGMTARAEAAVAAAQQASLAAQEVSGNVGVVAQQATASASAARAAQAQVAEFIANGGEPGEGDGGLNVIYVYTQDEAIAAPAGSVVALLPPGVTV